MNKGYFISNLLLSSASGGWSGMGKAIYEGLANDQRFSLGLCDAINPPVSGPLTKFSALLWKLKIPGPFSAFSHQRLKEFARSVDIISQKEQVDWYFFHGSTPWLLFKTEKPYFVYLDASFPLYLEIYHSNRKFSTDQIQKLCKLERSFLKNAKGIFFSSDFALRKTEMFFQEKFSQAVVAGLGGDIPTSIVQSNQKKKQFLFIGFDFSGKGGDLVVGAFHDFVKQNPGYQLHLVGGKPSNDEILKQEGVQYHGFLNKKNAEELNRLTRLYQDSIALFLPTSRDLTPLVIAEAGMNGCYPVSTNAFGISEMLSEPNTGYLLPPKPNKNDLVRIMDQIAQDFNELASFSGQIAEYYQRRFNWNNVTKRIGDQIFEELKKKV